MKFNDLLQAALGGASTAAHVAPAALGSAAMLVKTTSTLAIVLGAIYLADCRFNSKSNTREAIDSCYFTAGPIMGIGVAGRGGFQAGFNTFNPALRRPEESAPEAEGQGLFGRRERG